MSFSVAPGFLIAMPTLADPNFFRAVVVMCAHSKEGAFGLIINHRFDLPVADVCRDSDVAWRGGDEPRVYCGGPVERERGWVLHADSIELAGSESVGAGLSITTSLDALEVYGDNAGGPFRLVLGYAGWGPQQLEQEIAAGSWITAPLDVDVALGVPHDQIWERALQSVGVEPANLVSGGTLLN